MAKNFIRKEDMDKHEKQLNAQSKSNLRMLKEEHASLNDNLNLRKQMLEVVGTLKEEQNILNNLHQLEADIGKEGKSIRKDQLKRLREKQAEQLKVVNQLKKEKQLLKDQQEALEKKVQTQKRYHDALKKTGNQLTSIGKSMYEFLMKSDAAIKSVNLALGLSGERAAIMRSSFEESARFAAHLGMDMEGLAEMTAVYADETGRARLHSADNLKSMTLIAKGTNLGAEGAARMASQYEMMGMNATDTASEVQRIVDTTERMGVNTGKVLKAVNKNFKVLQKYTFRGGVQGMADMAIYAEKFKINMDSVFEPMEKGRRLDDVIEMSAELQVLGGQFANLADPMSMLFESRNDPKAYMKRINEMTKGMVTMNKEGDKFSLGIASPMAKDMLEAAAKALGMSTDELTTQALRMTEMQKTRSQMFGKGFTTKEKEIVEGLAKFSTDSGRMMVEVGGLSTDVSKLTRDQIKAMAVEQVSLKDRAEASQTFDQAFKNTIMELKSTLLPVLNHINDMLKYVRPVADELITFFDSFGGWGKTGLLVAGALSLAAANLAISFVKMKSLAGMSNISDKIFGVGDKSKGKGKGNKISGKMGKGAAAAGKGSMMKGAGVGAAALGIGGGIALAAVGIGKLAESMQKLDVDKMGHFELVALGLAVAIPAMAVGVVFLGKMAEASAIGVAVLTLAVMGIGVGIGVAAEGIGYMAEGMATLDKVDLSGAGAGMLKIGAAGLMLGNPMGLIGMATMTASVMAIGSSADNLERVGTAFANIGAVLQGSSGQFKEVRDTIQAIASTDLSSNSAIAGLTNMLSQPLKVEFSDKETAMVANIDLSVGDSGFMTEISKKVPINIRDLADGN